MPIEMFTYSQLGERLSCSPEAARALVRRLRLPRQKANDGKILVSVDLNEINHHPKPRSPAGHPQVTASLQAIEGLQAEMAKIDATVNSNRADYERERERLKANFEHERERLDGLIVELLQTKLDAQRAKEAVARLQAERSRAWWCRLASWHRVLGRSVSTREQRTA
jgi:hypothetical protein